MSTGFFVVDCGNICFCHIVSVQQFGDVSLQDRQSSCLSVDCKAFRQIFAPLLLGIPMPKLRIIYIIFNDLPLLLVAFPLTTFLFPFSPLLLIGFAAVVVGQKSSLMFDVLAMFLLKSQQNDCDYHEKGRVAFQRPPARHVTARVPLR